MHDTPGPAEYDDPEPSIKSPRKIRTHPDTSRGPAGKLWLTHPPRSIIPSGTSVPSKHDANGYGVNEHGVLVKNPAIETEPTFFYDIPRKETNTTTQRYKGNFWSRMKGRSDKRPPLTPGPGDYEHETRSTLTQICNEKVREVKRASSKQLRFLDALYRKKLLENFPAPNSYNLKGTFDRYFTTSCKCDSYGVKPPFNQTSQRFDVKVQLDTPAPGEYEIQTVSDCIGSIYPAPFGSCAGRFRKALANTGPAPGDYHTNVGNLAYDSAKRFKCRHGKPVRYIHFDKALISEGDGNVTSFVEEKSTKKCPVYNAAFKSKTKRFPETQKGTNVPDPGAYETLAAFKANRDKCDFLCSRLAPPFGSRSNRFPKIPEGTNVHVPDSSSYDVRGDIARNVKGGVISYPREWKEKSSGPSPSDYCIHPYLASSVLRKSFNVILGKPKVIEELSKKEKRTSPLCNRLVTRKLRCFAMPLKEYDYCTTY